jgi:hypothetical protein
MKKIFPILFLLLVIIAAFSVASAQEGAGLPGGGWWSGEQVQNVGGATATISITAYAADSDVTYTDSKDVAAGAAYTFTPINDFPTMPAGFLGSAVVSADQPIKAIVNVTNQPTSGVGVEGGKAAAQYQGTDASDVAKTLYFPLAKGDHFGKTSSFYIQNAGSAAATNVVATFTMRNGDKHVYSVPNIGVNKMVVFSVQNASTYAPTINDAKVGGLVVVGDQPLAGVVMEHDTVANPATVLASTRGFSASDFDDKAYGPVIKHDRFGRFTGLQVQNTSAGDINVTVTYKGTGGPCKGSSFEDSKTGIKPNTSHTFVQLGANTKLPANCTASATVVGTGNFVAITNEAETEGSPKAAIMSSALSDGASTAEVSVPLYKDQRFGATTGLQIQNVGDAEATSWTATFSCKGAATFTAISDPAKTGGIAKGAAYLFFTPSDDNVFKSGNPFSSADVNCAVIVEGDQPLVAIANEAPTTSGALDDNNYEGFNLTP